MPNVLKRCALHAYRLVVMAMIALSFCGCAKKGVPVPPQMTFTVRSDSATNNGSPFCLVVRSVEVQNFLTESYQDVAGMVFSTPSNSSVISSSVIFPGNKQKISVSKPAETCAGVYCLFSQPGEQWKMLLNQPLDSKYIVELGKDQILDIRKKKGFFRRLLFF